MPEDSLQITKLHRELATLRRQLAEARAALAASRDHNQFLAVLGHKLRNPLAPIRNSVALLKRAGSDDPIVQRAQEVIDRQVTELSWLVDDLVDSSGLLPGSLTVNREEQDFAKAAADLLPPPEAEAEARARPRRILIVEDLLDAAITTELLLEMLGHTVEIAADGMTALDTAERFAPEIILSDIGLPGPMDGYALARALRASARAGGAYLIALTGFGTPEDKARAEQAGFDLHLTKPIDPATLEALIARV